MINNRLLPLALVAAVTLAACGGGDDDTTDATTPASEPAATAVAPPTPPTAPTAPAAPSTPPPSATDAPAPTTAAPPTTDAAPATTEAVEGVPTEPPVAVEPMRVTLPGVVEITNPTVVPLLASVAEATGNTGGPEALLADYGLNTVPHVIVESGSLFEVSGSFDATFPDRPEYRLDQSYIVQSDAPDPAALLTAISDTIAATGAYDVETGSRTDDGLNVHYVDLSGTNYEDGLARWTLIAAHLGDTNPEWQGIIELQIETSGGLAATTVVPPALVELDAKATSEAPAPLHVYRYAFNNGINMFGGFPVRSADLYYLVEADDTSDFDAAAPTFDAALSPIYGAGDISLEDDTASWSSSPYTWSLRLDFEDRLAAVFGSSEF